MTILPDSMNKKTLMYVYSSLTADGVRTISPKIVTQKNKSINITWVNYIKGAPILPIDTKLNSMIKSWFATSVPIITHLHGLTTTSVSDGDP
jgi:hypothetical protein